MRDCYNLNYYSLISFPITPFNRLSLFFSLLFTFTKAHIYLFFSILIISVTEYIRNSGRTKSSRRRHHHHQHHTDSHRLSPSTNIITSTCRSNGESKAGSLISDSRDNSTGGNNNFNSSCGGSVTNCVNTNDNCSINSGGAQYHHHHHVYHSNRNINSKNNNNIIMSGNNLMVQPLPTHNGASPWIELTEVQPFVSDGYN